VVLQAIDAKIPVFVLDRNVETDKYTQFVGGDNKLIGRAAGEYAVELLGGPGKAAGNVVEIWGGMGTQPAHDRHDGFHAVTDKASAPLDWRLYMPVSWDDAAAATPEDAAAVRARRRKCQIPDTEHHQPKWRLALDMIDDLMTSGHRPPVIAADAGYGDTTAFRSGLHDG